MEYPIGFHFKPSDKEIVEYYLLPKLQGRPSVPNIAIIEADVYSCDPEILINEMYKDRGNNDRWYFLSPRTRKYQNGDRPSRRTADNRGRWKPSTGKKQKEKEEDDEYESEEDDEEPSNVNFCVTTLAYHVGPPNNEVKTKWLMKEITIPEYEIKVDSSVPGTMVLDRYVMCCVYVSPLSKWRKDNKGGAAGTAAPESGQGKAVRTTRQAGKRPAVQQQKRVRRPTRARGGPSPTPTHNDSGGAGATTGMPAPLGAEPTGSHDVVPAGQLTPRVPWPEPCNGMQGPVRLPQQQRPAVYMHNGWPVAPYYGRQAPPVQGLAGSSLRPPAPSDNTPHRTMVMRPPASPASFGNGMAMPITIRPPPTASFGNGTVMPRMRPPSPASFGNGSTVMPMRPAPPASFRNEMMLRPSPSAASLGNGMVMPMRPPRTGNGMMMRRPPSPASFGNGMMMMRRPPSPASFGNGMMMVTRPQQTGLNLAAHQTFPPPPAPQPGRQKQSDVDMNDPHNQRVFSELLAELKAAKSSSSVDAAQQQGPAAASNLPPQQQQQGPTFDAGAYNHPALANATFAQPGSSGDQQHQQHQQQQQQQCTSGGAAAPASAGNGEEALEAIAQI